MGTPEKIKPPPPPKPILLLTNSDDCSCDERHKVCSKHKMDNPSDNIAVLKCHIDSSATKYTVKPPLLPKPSNITYKASPYKVKHQFPSVKDQTADENNKTVKSIANRIGGIEIKDDISILYNEGLKTDSDVNSNISNVEVPVTINSPLENNVIDSENNNVDSITIKCTDNDSDFEFQNESLLNDYVVFDTDMLGVDIQSTIIEDEKSSIASDSTEQSYSVRKKIVNWFGSFGKGKNKKKQRSSFYNSQNESDKEENEENDTDSHSSMEDKSNEKLDLNESLSIDNIEPGEIISTKTKSLRIVEELISTEKVFIDVLKLLCKTFVTFVEQAGNDFKLIPSNELLKIISPLPQLLSLNEDLLHDMEKRMKNWEQHPKIADVIVKKGPFLKLYSTYIQNFEAQCNLLDECCHKYPRFQKCVKEFEASDVCKKLTIKHYMLKPIQRIPQYRMLLESYLKNLDESSIDYKDTSIALNIVCDVANHANKSIKQGDCLSKLLQIQSQLGNYEIIKPGRELVKEGELYKLSRKDMQLRYFILLNDCFLYTSYYGTVTGLKLNYELPLSGMKVFLPLTDDYYNEFNIITITRSFTLRAQTPEEREEWVTTLEEAIRVHNNKQLTFLNMKFIPKNAGCEPLKLGHEAPIWIQDCRVTMCQSCAAEFTVTFRRHHCRACGKVVCRSCSENRAPLHYRKFQSARVCDDCFDYLFKEVEDKIVEVRQTTSNLDETDILYKLDTIKNSFKKSGLWNTKRLVKYVPQRLKEVMANDTGSQISGWLYQRGRKSWKRYWFVLKEQVLYTYKASEDVVALNTVPVLGYSVQTFPEGTNYEDFDSNCVFQLAHAGQRPLIFCADIEQLAKRWINALNEATKLQ